MEIFYGFKNVLPLFIIIYAVLNIVVYLLRAWRFKILIGNKTRIGQLFSIVSIHTLFINLFPFGTGELDYPYLLKKGNITQGFAQGIPSLVLARVFDFFVVGIFFIISLVSMKVKINDPIWVFMIIIFLVLFLILLQVGVKKKENILSFLISKKETTFLG